VNGIRVPSRRLVSTARKGRYQTHRIPGMDRRLKLPKKPNVLVVDENQNRATDPAIRLTQPIINAIEALPQLAEHLPQGSGADFDGLFPATQSTKLRRD
jgi:hypothetical protein